MVKIVYVSTGNRHASNRLTGEPANSLTRVPEVTAAKFLVRKFAGRDFAEPVSLAISVETRRGSWLIVHTAFIEYVR